jgi:hypothetical protein
MKLIPDSTGLDLPKQRQFAYRKPDINKLDKSEDISDYAPTMLTREGSDKSLFDFSKIRPHHIMADSGDRFSL